ncbi:sensor histidine kinase [Blastococcus sp. SYSU DS0973]
MSTTGLTRRAGRSHALFWWVVIAGTTATLAVVSLPFVRFAYRAPALHVSLETANAVIALVVAYLVYGRFTRTRRLQELLLVLALCTVAVANLVLTALPSALLADRDEEFSRWAALAIRFLGTLVLTAAALTSPRVRLHRNRTFLTVIAVAGAVLLVGPLAVALGDQLPPTVDPGVILTDATQPRLVGHPVVLVAQAVGAGLYALAGAAFTRHAAREGDELLAWVGAGCVLGSFARIHYLLFPSLYSEFVYTGDLLRLGFYLLMLVGAAREIGSYWQSRLHAAVLEDRRRMARDLHDGLTQELSYISAQSQRLIARPDDTTAVERISAAAGRAVDEARRAINALTRPVDEPFPVGLQRLADELAHRYDVKIVTELDAGARVDAEQAEGLLRIAAEAMRNAVRHGGADRVELRLSSHPLSLTIRDDGRGFTVDGPESRTGGFGLTSMRERAEGMCADFVVTSAPGEGTTVRVTWT